MTTDAPYQDPRLAVEERVGDLLARMSLDEKLAQLGAVEFPLLMTEHGFDADAALARVPFGIGEVTRIGATTGLEPVQSAELLNRIQRVLVERTRLGIPTMVHEESVAGYCARGATVFPQALALASSWDPALVEEVADRIRVQMFAVGARHALAPVLDIARDPRWGRLEETYGEDPVLAGALGSAYVRGMQTDDLTRGVLATGKHFLAHGLSEGGRNHAPVQIGPRELREIYAEPFAAAVRHAGLASVMSSYSCVDGLPGSGSREILTTLLRDELGFVGLVVADYFSVSLLMRYHRVAADRSEAAVKALTAGLDLELPALDCFGEPLREAVMTGRAPVEAVDGAVRRVLTAKMRLGLFESPYVDTGRVRPVFDDPTSAALARRAATRAVVLLANDGLLPLTRALSKVAVIGPAADDRRLLQGDYHYPAHLDASFEHGDVPEDFTLPSGTGALRPGAYYTDHVTLLAGLRAALAPEVELLHEKGCEVVGNDSTGIASARAAAAAADVAIVAVGGRSGLGDASTVGEARDAADLRLTGLQEQLVEAVTSTGTPTVLIVMSGRAHVLTGLLHRVQALVVAWPLGEQGGNALADVLLGRAEPTGRLAVTLPRSVGQVPLYHSHRSGGSRSVFYDDYTDCPHTPLFAFGHGLGYTTFAYSDIVAEGTDTLTPVTVAVTVSNTGQRDGEEVVQLYVADLVASVARPEAMLIGFTRVSLPRGGSARVTFTVHPSRLAFYDEAMNFVVEPGRFRFAVGSSAGDIRQRAEVELAGAAAPYLQRAIVPVSTEVSVKDLPVPA
jgi:beta-glucosidase